MPKSPTAYLLNYAYEYCELQFVIVCTFLISFYLLVLENEEKKKYEFDGQQNVIQFSPELPGASYSFSSLDMCLIGALSQGPE